VFATDLDDDAIRAGARRRLSAAIAADVSEERLRRFFTRDVRGYRIRSEIARGGRLRHHDLLKDAPFSRLDLVSCRNLFIYLDPQRSSARSRSSTSRCAARPALPRRLGDGRLARASVSRRRPEAPHLRAAPGARARLPPVRGDGAGRALGCTGGTSAAAARPPVAAFLRAGRARKRSASARGASCT
jgi:hypothetical protein